MKGFISSLAGKRTIVSILDDCADLCSNRFSWKARVGGSRLIDSCLVAPWIGET